MHDNIDQGQIDGGLLTLQYYCLCLIEFISDQVTDPHLYFQNKLTADISRVESLAELRDILDYLIGWVESMGSQSVKIIELDNKLAEQDLPTFSLMRVPDNRELGRILAVAQVATKQEYHLVLDSIREAPGISGPDRLLGERIVAAYESKK